MCGIAGIIGLSLPAEQVHQRVISMRDRLRHRGPDDQGLFVDANCVLAHSRLSILDLSRAGHQPMSTPDGRYAIVFNGEIYNFASIRDELRQTGVTFHSHTDTEVILRLYERDGAECVERLEGMFAFAIWDRIARSCFFARDPLGIKPLYLWPHNGQIAFSSEIRSLLLANLAARRLSATGLTEYLMHGSVQEPGTLIEGIVALPAGHHLEWRQGISEAVGLGHEPVRYWDIRFAADMFTRETAAKKTREALDDSIRRHFVSDVPVGIFLSGGIDSTAIVALARAAGHDELSTFCIGFEEAEFDEGDLAGQTSQHFKTNHHRWTMTAGDGKNLLSGFLDSIDQPSNDGFNTYCVSKFARDAGLKVVLSGLGGDELFGGYPSFSRVPALARWARRAQLIGPLRQVLGTMGQSPHFPAKLRRMAALFGSSGAYNSAYWAARGFFTPRETAKLVSAYTGVQTAQGIFELMGSDLPKQPSDKDIVSYLEMTRYMRNQLLRDSDVMSMSHGLELRVPFVDRKLVDIVGKIPSSLRHAPGKRLILDAIPEIPDWIANQPKRGFRFPFDRWISSQWGDVFTAIDVWSPVRLERWYRRWALFTLNHFLRQNDIACLANLP